MICVKCKRQYSGVVHTCAVCIADVERIQRIIDKNWINITPPREGKVPGDANLPLRYIDDGYRYKESNNRLFLRRSIYHDRAYGPVIRHDSPKDACEQLFKHDDFPTNEIIDLMNLVALNAYETEPYNESNWKNYFFNSQPGTSGGIAQVCDAYMKEGPWHWAKFYMEGNFTECTLHTHADFGPFDILFQRCDEPGENFDPEKHGEAFGMRISPLYFVCIGIDEIVAKMRACAESLGSPVTHEYVTDYIERYYAEFPDERPNVAVEVENDG